MRSKFVAAAAAALTLVSIAGTADAITRGGTLDGTDHPYVGLMAAVDDSGERIWRCSGSLISPTVFVTAGHCVSTLESEPIDHALVWFDTDVENMDPAVSGYRDDYVIDGTGTIQDTGTATQGTAHPHPLYFDPLFFLNDLGVVVLDQPVILNEYAALPAEGYIDDEMTSGRNKSTSTVTAVGYGLQKIISSAQGRGQTFVQADKVRYQADLMVVNTKGVAGVGAFAKSFEGTGSIAVSGDAKHGGTCFGDSGGPMLADGNVLVAVNSFGLNGNCAGIGGAYRIDQSDDLDFIHSFLSD